MTSDWNLTKEQGIQDSNQRCAQENLVDRVKEGVRARHALLNILVANWAYMVVATLAWFLKTWLAF